jgi:hypothetical protein
LFPIRAYISLLPTSNFNNSTSATITKIANFTLSLSPPLTSVQQFNEAWNAVGPALNGFIGIITALIGVGGVIGGWFLRKFRGKENLSVDEYRRKQSERWE